MTIVMSCRKKYPPTEYCPIGIKPLSEEEILVGMTEHKYR